MSLTMVVALLVQVATFSYYVSQQNAKITELSKQLEVTNQSILDLDSKKLPSVDAKIDRIGLKVQQLDVELGLHVKKRIEIFPYQQRQAAMAAPPPPRSVNLPDEIPDQNPEIVAEPKSLDNRPIPQLPKNAAVILDQ